MYPEACLEMSFNPSIERTRVGLWPPQATHVKRGPVSAEHWTY